MSMNELYKDKTIRYDQTVAEITAENLLEQVNDLFAIRKITRIKSYDANHLGETNSKAETLTEKRLAINLFNNEYEYIGKIFDYEVPLKNSNKDEGVGKIDLIAKNGNEVVLLELKVEGSTETLLRCILEVFTYWKILDHQKFLYDFGLPQDTIIKKAVFVFENSTAFRQYSEKQSNKKTLELMKKLEVDLFLLHEVNGSYKVIKPR